MRRVSRSFACSSLPGPMDLPRARSARASACPPPRSLSTCRGLCRRDLVAARRAGRQIFYAARYERMTALLRFLVEDCCARAPSGCLPGCPSTLLDRGRR